jgi:hypothetical protein
VQEALDRGELSADIDVETAVDALVTSPYYRLIFAMPALDEDAVARQVRMVWRGCQPPAD